MVGTRSTKERMTEQSPPKETEEQQRKIEEPTQESAQSRTAPARGNTDPAADATDGTDGTTTTEETATTSGTTATSVTKVNKKTSRRNASQDGSRRSQSARKKLLEAEERLAQQQLEEMKAARKLAEIQLERARVEEELSEDEADHESESDATSASRIEEWLEKQPANESRTQEEEEPCYQLPPAEERRSKKDEATAVEYEVRSHQQESRPNALSSMNVTTLAAAIAQGLQAGTKKIPANYGDLPVFAGHSGSWLAYRAIYMETEDYFTKNENVVRLRKSLRGIALETVSSLLLAQPDPQEIMDALERRFGRPDALIQLEAEKLKKLPRVSDGPRDICIFASKVANVVATIEAMKKVHYLYNPEMVRAMLDKLTPVLKEKWYDYSATIGDAVPEMKKMAQFLNKEADKRSAYAPPEQAPVSDQDKKRKPERSYTASGGTSEECPLCQRSHTLRDCETFGRADVNKRWELAKQHKYCYRCLNSTHRRFKCKAPVCGQQQCRRPHHRLLHNYEDRKDTAAATTESKEVSATTVEQANAAGTPPRSRRAYLKILPVVLTGPTGASVTVHALLDEGSTITILDDTVASLLELQGPAEPMWVQGISGAENKHEHSRRVNVRIRGKYSDTEYTISDARTVERLNFTSQSVKWDQFEDCQHLGGLREEITYEEASPKLLIGQDNWELVVSREIRAGRRDQPVASLTLLGWVLHGCRNSHNNPVAFCGHLSSSEERIEEMMKHYFELESIGITPKKQKGDPEQRALDILDATSRRLPDGRYETGLLWREDNVQIPNNYNSALNRLHNLEKKLDREPELKRKYEERITHLLDAGYAEPAITAPTEEKTWYLPHFAVVNPAKPNIRVVHDAAAKYQGRSLNSMLLPGPDLLQSLPGVVMRFRQHPVAVSADIKEMFMQIKVRSKDRDALRFLWRGDLRGNAVPRQYRMTSVIFGATSSPCTALYIKNRNATEFTAQHPKAAEAILRSHYMDDYIASYENVEEAKTTSLAVDNIHKRAGFELRGWASNEEAVVNALTSDRGEATISIGGSDIEKTLGLLWHTDTDHIGFRINRLRSPPEVLQGQRPPTKREALGTIMSLYDPLGLIAPITTPAKRLMQDTWVYGTGWDEELPQQLQARWSTWLTTVRELQYLQVPRCYDYEPAARYELHTFVDASEEAYAAAVYWRATRADGSVNVALTAAKSRVTPLKPTSVPRLELQAALLGARLAHTVTSEHDFKAERKVYWSDSTTTLAWIQAEPRAFKTFVAHRLAEIEELTKKNEWRWLPSEHNVADDATRATPGGFNESHRWFTGPTFLYQPEDTWPIKKEKLKIDTSEHKEVCNATDHAQRDGHAHLPDVARFSRWTRLIRTTARAIQFIELCRARRNIVAATKRKRTRANKDSDPTWTKTRRATRATDRSHNIATEKQTRKYLQLEARHLNKAEVLWIKSVQEDSFKGGDRLTELRTFVDTDGVIRLQSRIHSATDISEDAASPIVLCGKHAYTKLYIRHVHSTLHHGGVETVVNELRQRLWIVKVRPAVKNALKSCMTCRLKKAKPASPLTGDLPYARLAHHARPYTFTGLDYLGPYEVTVTRHHEKRYVALFTCMTSRAIHLEVATSLSADSAIAALRRFIARRGCPKEIWSDNATCFHAANKELAEAPLGALREEAANNRITWRFQPPAAPFMCGVWERMVRSVKEALRHTLHEKYPSDEVFATLITEVEWTVNSRPLTHVAVDPAEPEALTPNHILVGPNAHLPPAGDFTSDDLSARQQWRRAQRLADVFWRRWVREYLPLLQHRRETATTGTVPKIGDVVVVADSNLPRGSWPRGRVTRLYPGKDGEVRVVDITTSNGHTLRRPTKKIVVLPVES